MSVASRSAPLSAACFVAISAAVAFGATVATPAPVLAQQVKMNRCIGPGGGTIYTDRACEELGSIARIPRTTATMGTTLPGGRRTSCSRTLQDLVYEVSAAIDSHDVNRLGGVYHWVGQDQTSGERILDRLQAIVDRPLEDIAVTRNTVDIAAPSPPAIDSESGAAPQASAAAEPTDVQPGAEPATADPASPAPTRRRAVVTGLRIEQTLRNTATPARTVFALRRYYDCWWIAF